MLEKAELKAEAWAELLRTRKIGYFALLRNLRNIAEQAPELVPTACELLTDERLIRKSLVLPFRFSTALEASASCTSWTTNAR
jgi:60 kDa SS-A/Ro ribonucleoprotein